MHACIPNNLILIPNNETHLSNVGWLVAEFGGNCLLVVHVWYSFHRLGTPQTVQRVTSNSTFSAELGQNASWFNAMQTIYAAILLFFSLRIFKYLRVFAALHTLWDTIKNVSRHIGYLVVITLILLCGFGVFAHLSFGFISDDYNSLPSTAQSLFIILLGELNYEALQVMMRKLFTHF
jgi:hypothetical protein